MRRYSLFGALVAALLLGVAGWLLFEFDSEPPPIRGVDSEEQPDGVTAQTLDNTKDSQPAHESTSEDSEPAGLETAPEPEDSWRLNGRISVELGVEYAPLNQLAPADFGVQLSFVASSGEPDASFTVDVTPDADGAFAMQATLEDLPDVEGYWCVRIFTARGVQPWVSGRFNFARWCEDEEHDPAKVAGHIAPVIQGQSVNFGDIVVNADSLLGIAKKILVTGKLVHISGQPVANWQTGELGRLRKEGTVRHLTNIESDAHGVFSATVWRSSWDSAVKHSSTLAFAERKNDFVCGTLNMPDIGESDTLIALGDVTLDSPMVYFAPVWPAGVDEKGLVGVDTRCGSTKLDLTFDTTGGVAFLFAGQHQWLTSETISNTRLNRPSGTINLVPHEFMKLEIVFEKLPCVVIRILLQKRNSGKNIPDAIISTTEGNETEVYGHNFDSNNCVIIEVSENPRTAVVSVEGWVHDGELFIPSGAGVYDVTLIAKDFGTLEVIYPELSAFSEAEGKIATQYIRKSGEPTAISSRPFEPTASTIADHATFEVYEEGTYEYSIEEGYGLGYEDGRILEPILFKIVFGETTKLVLPTLPPPPWKFFSDSIKRISQCEGRVVATTLKVRFKDGTESWEDTSSWPYERNLLNGNPITGWLDGDKLVPVALRPPTAKRTFLRSGSIDNNEHTIVQMFDLPARIDVSVTANGEPLEFTIFAVGTPKGEEAPIGITVSSGRSYLPVGKHQIYIFVAGTSLRRTVEVGTSGITDVHFEMADETEVTFKENVDRAADADHNTVWRVYRTDSETYRTVWVIEGTLMLVAGEYVCISDIPGTPEISFVITEGLTKLEVQLPAPSATPSGSGKLELEFSREMIAAPYKMEFWYFVLPNRPSRRSIIHRISTDEYSNKLAAFTETKNGAEIQNIPNSRRICILGQCSVGVGSQTLYYSLEPVFIDSFKADKPLTTQWIRLVPIDKSLDFSSCLLFKSQNVGVDWYEFNVAGEYGAPHAPVGRHEVGFCRGQSNLLHREWLDFRVGKITKLDAETKKRISKKLYGKD